MKKDKFFAQGRVNIRVIEVKTGKVLQRIQGKNLIVNVGRDIVCNLINNSQGANQWITTIQVGTNGTTPTLADTAITSPVSKLIATATFNPQEVNFNWSLETSEANGVAINEFGLVCGDGSLFARKVVGTGQTINKTNLIRIEGDWTITF